MAHPNAERVTVDDLRMMSPQDLEKYRPSSWAKVLVSLFPAELEKLAAGDPDDDTVRWSERKYPLRKLARELAPEVQPRPGLDPETEARRLLRSAWSEQESQQIRNGMALAERFLNAPGLRMRIESMLDELEERSVGRADVGRFITEQHLKALQLFTYAARVPAGDERTDAEYQYASLFFRRRGDRFAASIMHSFGYYVGEHVDEHKYQTGGDVHADHVRWVDRHRHWQDLASSGVAVLAGRGRRGVDGAPYVVSDCAVTVATPGGRTETVAFPGREEAEAWAANRSRAADGPLLTTEGGPLCRTVREDEILAGLLRDPGDPELRAHVDDQAVFTSHLRAELARTLTSGDPGRARDRFAGTLRRAPGWALNTIGWDTHRALAYFDRLAATPVSPAQAREAAAAVAEAHDRDEQRLIDSTMANRAVRRTVPRPRVAAQARQPLLAPPPPLPVSAGPVARH